MNTGAAITAALQEQKARDVRRHALDLVWLKRLVESNPTGLKPVLRAVLVGPRYEHLTYDPVTLKSRRFPR